MAEIIYRIPSAIPYAYVEVHVKDISALPDPVMLAAQYAAYYDAYSKEEKAAIQRALKASPGRGPGVHSGPKEAADAPQAASQDQDMVKAHEILAEGLGGVTEVPDESTYKSLDEQADAMIKSGGDAPWNKPVAEAKPKPWESDGW